MNKDFSIFNMKDSTLGDIPIVKSNKFNLIQCLKNDIERRDIEKIHYASIVVTCMIKFDTSKYYVRNNNA